MYAYQILGFLFQFSASEHKIRQTANNIFDKDQGANPKKICILIAVEWCKFPHPLSCCQIVCLVDKFTVQFLMPAFFTTHIFHSNFLLCPNDYIDYSTKEDSG